MPDGIDLVTAAGLIEVAATVVSNLRLAGLADGERLLVHGGAGGIGSFAIQYAKALGATVIATTAGSPDKLDYCRSIGADLAISYRDDWPAAVSARDRRAGVDVILDVMGAEYLEPNVGCLATGGRLVVIGLQGGRQGTLDLGRCCRKRGHVIATNLRGRPVAEKSDDLRRGRGDGLAAADQRRDQTRPRRPCSPSPTRRPPIAAWSRATTSARSS